MKGNLLERIERAVSKPILQHMIATIHKGPCLLHGLLNGWIQAKLNDQERKEMGEVIDKRGVK